MGQKANPTALRTGLVLGWKSHWFNRKRYSEYLQEDTKIRDFIVKNLVKMGLESVEIERSLNAIKVIIHTSKPGLIIGRGGGGIEQLRAQLQKFINQPGTKAADKRELRMEVTEIKQPESFASLAAQSVVEQIERRIPYRRIMKQTIERIIQSKDVQGAKIMIKGRLDGAEIARKEWLAKGRMPLQTLRANVNYAAVTAHTTYGTVGVKVWIYKGEIFE
ncbi:MAG: 30S ribosomal protein S3 [Candidatus Portnoybacteria bacterium CG_4_8_14_3_um_filter_44_10]|uniref:Small ribosomal subunit protein uS3 n=4 Tax=Candidatus Portnoyibacteriota TaxID=1817913 RepID=A0A2H0KT91_9BACT|nr:MAG: 30S ribosomal protein S3 [Parcubacteria group bacterium CG2_30_44_18]PIQ74644.1 MAG: 30S ribosomal protein S3 [Candidatus Portnoybacteria bacterium CG11_big_fil_rev_8_21_14_0_20_44_10]PIS16521.1 MAG: 30S ribosomal protein S3 [Candidatus Portnoybacteria bacterium CG09_land_8_20_14_0_10_44_13]PIW75143.1 MAG: 30S ribosomal protein S3 [Candidatus Portnoybacteria bacterium CG_4_8_14_3_um_filter_44_10]PIZ69808.1 MAG: 30S ribosomal protein S3 [Candidatus Portnoybacteria bacterium CG_4_10_14_0_